MEADPHNPVGEQTPAIFTPESIPLDVIRTETVFSKLPIHNLAKKGRVNIQITKLGPKGQIELKWEVSYSDRYGQARQLAYKLDTIVIDQKLEEAGKPLPERIRLGSINQVAQELGMDADQGPNTRHIKTAFLQNASAFITAKLRYKANDGTEHTFEAGFTRYTVIFTGQKFSDGTKADAVYIELHPRYREVLNNAPVRPLDLGYKKQLPPAPQRFYEIVSYKIFTALKYNQPAARLAYSEYCTFSAQQRYFDYDHFKKQMYKVLKPHKDSGYITSTRYNAITDEQNQPDWMMLFTPGPKARAEYAHFTGKKPRAIDAARAAEMSAAGESGESNSRQQHRRPRQRRLNFAPAAEQPSAAIIDYQLVSELAKRGVGDSDARQLLTSLKPGQPILDQLEWGDYQIEQARGKITNPPGFYISLLQRDILVPTTFETSRARKARQDAESAQAEAIQKERQAALAAEEAERQKLDSEIAELPEEARLALLSQAKADVLAKHPNMAVFFHNHPDSAIEDGAVRATIKTLLSQGWTWKPHQAINPPVRQDDPLQETLPVEPASKGQAIGQPSPMMPNLQAILSTPQLSPPPVEQAAVEPAPAPNAPDISDHLL
jgi:hypothetical protein